MQRRPKFRNAFGPPRCIRLDDLGTGGTSFHTHYKTLIMFNSWLQSGSKPSLRDIYVVTNLHMRTMCPAR